MDRWTVTEKVPHFWRISSLLVLYQLVSYLVHILAIFWLMSLWSIFFSSTHRHRTISFRWWFKPASVWRKTPHHLIESQLNDILFVFTHPKGLTLYQLSCEISVLSAPTSGWCCEHRSVACGVHQKLPSPYVGSSVSFIQWIYNDIEIRIRTYICIYIYIHMVGGLEHFFIFHFIYGMSSFPLTNSYFSRWLSHHQPDII